MTRFLSYFRNIIKLSLPETILGGQRPHGDSNLVALALHDDIRGNNRHYRLGNGPSYSSGPLQIVAASSAAARATQAR